MGKACPAYQGLDAIGISCRDRSRIRIAGEEGLRSLGSLPVRGRGREHDGDKEAERRYDRQEGDLPRIIAIEDAPHPVPGGY